MTTMTITKQGKRASSHSTTRAAVLATVLALLAPVAGCQSKGRDAARVKGSDFRPEGETRAVHRFNDVQTAAGARQDATLRAHHFDGDDLNSLGRRKVDQMLRDDDASDPIVVYLDTAKDDLYAAREDAVRVYLKDRGLADEHVKVAHGPNTKNLGPTGPGLRAKKLLDAGATIAVNPEPTGSPSAGMTGAAPGQ